MRSNDAAGISFSQPKTFEDRFGIAEKCAAHLDMTTPVLIDSIDNATCESYAAFPDRLYIVDRDGNIAYKGGRGPFGYKPRELEQALLLLMMEDQIKSAESAKTSGGSNPSKKQTKASKLQSVNDPGTGKKATGKPAKSATPRKEKPVPPGPDLPQKG